MGLLDGDLQSIFGGVFAPFFLDGVLHSDPKVEYANGRPSGETTWTDTPVKGMVDNYSERYKATNGIPETDVKVIVLQAGIATEPSLDAEISIRGTRYRIMAIGQDPAQAAWEFRGRPVG